MMYTCYYDGKWKTLTPQNQFMIMSYRFWHLLSLYKEFTVMWNTVDSFVVYYYTQILSIP